MAKHLPVMVGALLAIACQPTPAAPSAIPIATATSSAVTSTGATAATWKRIADIPTGRSEIAVAVSGQQSKIFVIGGFGGPERVEWTGGAIVAIAGGILAIVAVSIGIANDVFVMNGADIVGLRESALMWSVLGLGIVAALAIMGGLVAGLVSWIGALLNVSQLESKTWFLILLLLGIFNLGIIGMIAYLIAGPDGTTRSLPPRAYASAGA